VLRRQAPEGHAPGGCLLQDREVRAGGALRHLVLLADLLPEPAAGVGPSRRARIGVRMFTPALDAQ
jgi:hypothetical protein